MRVFLRSKKTRLYRTGSNGWAAAIGQAVEFTSVPRAIKFALDGSLREAEVVIRCDLLAEEVTLPLVADWHEPDRPRPAAA
jgi:hypothetical protein